MRNFTIPAPELAAWLGSGVRSFRVRVRRPEEVTWTNLSDVLGGDWVLGVQMEGETPDTPANRFTLRFLKHATEGSLSPGISASPLNIDAALEFRPLLHPGRSVEVDVRVDAYPWRLWLKGEMEEVDWAADEVVALCETLDGVLVAAQIEAEEERGSADPGTAIEAEIQGLITRWMNGTGPTLRTVGTPLAGVGIYTPTIGSIGSQARALAQRIGWDLRYQWSEADGAYRLTLYQPPRDNTTPDLLLPADQMFGVPGLKQSRKYVRNAFPTSFTNAAGDIEHVSPEITDPVSIAEYRRQAMVIAEGSDSPIRTEAQAIALANYAKSDLSRPLVDGRYEMPFLPWLELHDVLVLEADDDHFDYDTQFAVVGVSHRVDPEGGPWTEVDLRGGTPVGQYYSWHSRRPPPPLPDSRYALNNFTRKYTATLVQSAWEPGSEVAEVWIFDVQYDVESMPIDPYPNETTDLATYQVLRVGVDDMEYAAVIPAFGFVRCLQFEARTASLGFGPGNGTIIRFEVQPNQIGTEGFEDFSVNGSKIADAALDRSALFGTRIVLEGAIALRSVGSDILKLAGVARENVIDKALNAIKIDDATLTLSEFTRVTAAGAIPGSRLASSTLDLTEFSRIVANDAIVGQKLSVNELSEITDDVGIVIHGELRNAAGTRYINLDASGAQPFILHPNFEIRADGTALFKGALVAVSGTFVGSLESGATSNVALSALNANIGTITAGVLQNEAGVNYMDLDATGSQVFLKCAGALEAKADGTVTFAGTLAAPSGTFGQVTVPSGGYVRSSNYSSGSAGWEIGPTSAEFNDVTVRGTVASQVFTGSIATFSGDDVRVGVTSGLHLRLLSGAYGVRNSSGDVLANVSSSGSDGIFSAPSGAMTITAQNAITIGADPSVIIVTGAAEALRIAHGGGATGTSLQVSINAAAPVRVRVGAAGTGPGGSGKMVYVD